MTTDGKNLVSHAGTSLLSELADRSGLTLEACRRRWPTCGISWHTHDPGVVLTHLAVADRRRGGLPVGHGGAAQPAGAVRPGRLEPDRLAGGAQDDLGRAARHPAGASPRRGPAWKDRPAGGEIVIWTSTPRWSPPTRTSKEDAAPTYKRGFGFHPLGAWATPPASPWRRYCGRATPARTTPTTTSTLLDQADRPPAARAYQAWATSAGDDPALVQSTACSCEPTRPVPPTDSSTPLTEANIDYSIGYAVDAAVRGALLLAQEEDWVPGDRARRQVCGGRLGDRADRADGTVELVARGPAGSFPAASAPTPAPSSALFDTAEGFRHTCFITNTAGHEVPFLELRHRGHARVEDRVRSWKDCGLSNLPFDSFPQNQAWVAVSLVAGALLAWAQMCLFKGDLAKAEPKTPALPRPARRRPPRPPRAIARAAGRRVAGRGRRR